MAMARLLTTPTALLSKPQPSLLVVPTSGAITSHSLHFGSFWKVLSQGSPLIAITTCQSSPAHDAQPTVIELNAIQTTEELAPSSRYIDTSTRIAPDIWKLEIGQALSTTPLTTKDTETMSNWIECIREKLRTMLSGDGEINESAYDTAWVARVPSLSGAQQPEFPKALEWVLENQYVDGSWGDGACFLLYDRICHTLSCILTLKSWDVGSENILRGVDFIWKHIDELSKEEIAHMPIGFELVFPTMLEEAKQMELDLPYTTPFIEIITNEMKKKFATQEDGSLMCSPASTAVALMHTGDRKCRDYLSNLLKKFGNAVPTIYPIDIYHHLWVIDTLERLGISHHFQNEIVNTLDFIYRYWSDVKGIGWTKNLSVEDIDDTSMAFRLLRQHGYNVSSEAFKQFNQHGQYCCFVWQTRQGVSDMLTLYRASQIACPNEVVLKEGGAFAIHFLNDKLSINKGSADKWCLKKDLPGEVSYALRYPYHKSLPLIDIKSYINKYGVDDAWIGKTLYRLPLVNNRMYLDLAKAEYNAHQSIFRAEIDIILSWYKATGMAQLSFVRHRPIEVFYSIAANLYEAEFSAVRLYWTRCAILTYVLDDLFDNHASIPDLQIFVDSLIRWDINLVQHALPDELKVCFMALYNETNNVIKMASNSPHKDETIVYIRQVWERLLKAYLVEAEWMSQNITSTSKEYKKVAIFSAAVEPTVMTASFASGVLMNNSILFQLDMRGKAMQYISYSARLLNDIATYAYERRVGKCNSISCYMNENSNATEEMAVANFQAELDHLREQINSEMMKLTVPDVCKRILFSMYRAFNHFYDCGTDAVTANTEIQYFVRQTLFEPID